MRTLLRRIFMLLQRVEPIYAQSPTLHSSQHVSFKTGAVKVAIEFASFEKSSAILRRHRLLSGWSLGKLENTDCDHRLLLFVCQWRHLLISEAQGRSQERGSGAILYYTSYKSIDLDKWRCDFHASACRLASPNGNLKNGILWEGCPLPPEVKFIHFSSVWLNNKRHVSRIKATARLTAKLVENASNLCKQRIFQETQHVLIR